MRARGARTLARAKINLRLRIGPRSADGYHGVDTIYQLIDLADRVSVDIGAAGRELTLAGSVPGAREQNLAWRAAVAYEQSVGWPGSWHIHVEKSIPVGGGLGGGSADAAAVLRCLNALSPSPVGPAELLRIALGVGSDVPFFATGWVLAHAGGRGERLTELPPLPARDVTLFASSEAVSTAEAFHWLDEDRTDEPELASTQPPPASWPEVIAAFSNDFEPVVSARRSDIRRVLETTRLRPEVELAGLSGSGATVFALTSGTMGASLSSQLPAGTRRIGSRTSSEAPETERFGEL